MTLKVAASPAAEELDPTLIDPALAGDEGVSDPIDANPAESSPVDPTDANKPANLLDVIKSAVEKPAELVDPSPAESDPAKPEGEAPAAEAEAKPEDDANLPFHNHPRFKGLITERDELRTERDSFRDGAERWQAIDTWRQEKNLTPEEVAEGYQIMALLKSGDHGMLSQARDWFSERLSNLDDALGIAIPTDLQERIDSGILDEEGAQEIARARAAVTLRKNKETADAEASAATTAESEVQALTNEMTSAVNDWETRTKASDPDYAKKANLMQDRCLRIVRDTGSAPKSAAEATALADRAYKEITDELRASLPKPKPIAPAPVGRSTSAAPAPTTLRDAINAAVGR